MFIDVNCSLGTWPFRRLDIADAASLAGHLRSERIDSALVSSLDAAFHNDPTGENEVLFEAVTSEDTLYPVPVVNPRIRNWASEVDRYLNEHKARAVKLHPSYHRYALEADFVDALAGRLAEAGVPLMVALRLEDERLHHPNMQVPGVPAPDVRALALRHASLSVVVLNGYRNDAKALQGIDNLFVDIAFVEAYKSIDSLCTMIPASRVLYGSHTPLFVTRAASMKVVWAETGDDELERIASGNAAKLFKI